MACLAIAAGCNQGPDTNGPAPGTLERIEIGEPVPDLAMTLLDESDDRASVRVRDLAGGPVIVNFWASWCIPCRKEFPLFENALAKYPDLQIIGVVFDDSAPAALRFSRERDASWIMVSDPEGRVARAYRVTRPPGIPQTFFLDREGVLVSRVYGEIGEEVLDKQIRGLMSSGL